MNPDQRQRRIRTERTALVHLDAEIECLKQRRIRQQAVVDSLEKGE